MTESEIRRIVREELARAGLAQPGEPDARRHYESMKTEYPGDQYVPPYPYPPGPIQPPRQYHGPVPY